MDPDLASRWSMDDAAHVLGRLASEHRPEKHAAQHPARHRSSCLPPAVAEPEPDRTRTQATGRRAPDRADTRAGAARAGRATGSRCRAAGRTKRRSRSTGAVGRRGRAGRRSPLCSSVSQLSDGGQESPPASSANDEKAGDGARQPGQRQPGRRRPGRRVVGGSREGADWSVTTTRLRPAARTRPGRCSARGCRNRGESVTTRSGAPSSRWTSSRRRRRRGATPCR